ncbi:MAG: HdeD family acid-resistance protein [Xanthobacteraceae bacterium]
MAKRRRRTMHGLDTKLNFSSVEIATDKRRGMEKSKIKKNQSAVARLVPRYRVLSVVEALVLIGLGVAAIVMPRTLAVEILFGWLFLISGITGLITTLRIQQMPGFWWSLVSAILGIAAGLIMLVSPERGVLSLTLILIVFFAIEGTASILFALDHKREQSGNWSWMLLSGIIDLFLAATILLGLPGTAAWALGLLVGVNLIVGGSALLAMALHARGRSDTQEPSAPGPGLTRHNHSWVNRIS